MADDFELAAQGEEIEDAPLEPADSPDTEEQEDTAPVEEAPAEEEPAVDPEFADLLQEGETPEQALRRIAAERDEQAGRARRHYGELGDLKSKFEQMEEHVRRLEQAHGKPEGAEEETEEPPDPTAQPVESIHYRLDQLQKRLDQEAEERRRQTEQIQQDEERRAQLENMAAIDNYAATVINEGLGIAEGAEPDPDFVAAYNAVNRFHFDEIKEQYPGEPDHKVEEALRLINTIEHRRAIHAGRDLREHYKSFNRRLQKAIEAANKAKPKTEEQPTNGAPSPSDVEKQARSRQSNAGLHRVHGGGGGAPARDPDDPTSLTEEEYAARVESGKLDPASAWADLAAD